MENKWSWATGKVDRENEHIVIQHDDVDAALLSPPDETVFTVEFLTEDDKVRAYIVQELNFFLVEKGEEDPWAYAQYHCTTTANVYSLVHWSFHINDN